MTIYYIYLVLHKICSMLWTLPLSSKIVIYMLTVTYKQGELQFISVFSANLCVSAAWYLLFAGHYPQSTFRYHTPLHQWHHNNFIMWISQVQKLVLFITNFRPPKLAVQRCCWWKLRHLSAQINDVPNFDSISIIPTKVSTQNSLTIF